MDFHRFGDASSLARIVIRAIFFLLLMEVVSLAEPAWQQGLSPSAPGIFPPPKPVHATYRFGWMGFTAGAADVTFSRAKPDQLQLEVKGGSIGFVRTLWRLDATHTACASAVSLRPISVRQREVYSWQTVRTELDFDADGVTRFRESTHDQTPAKSKRFKFSNLYDMHSALLFFRSQRLQPGDVYSVVVYPASTPYLVTIRVLGRDKVQVPGGKFAAIKTELKLQKINRDLSLEPHVKFKRGYVWLSDDADRLLIKVQAEIFVGSVWMELQQAQTRR